MVKSFINIGRTIFIGRWNQQYSRCFCLLFLCSFMVSLKAQSPKASLKFLNDSLWIGKSCSLRLEVFHPVEMFIEPEDGENDFAPFELVEVIPEPTQTEDGVSFDAAIYRLKSFSIQKWQTVKLGLNYTLEEDTLTLIVISDSIPLMEMVNDTQNADFLRDTTLLSLDDPVDYSQVLGLALVLLILLILLMRMLRKPLKRYWAKQRIRREWKQYRSSLKRLLKQELPPKEFIRQVNRLWKSYLDPEEELGLISKTTSELSKIEKSEQTFSDQQKRIMVKASKMADDILFAEKFVPPDDLKRIGIEVRELMLGEYKRRKDRGLRN